MECCGINLSEDAEMIWRANYQGYALAHFEIVCSECGTVYVVSVRNTPRFIYTEQVDQYYQEVSE